MLPALIKFCPNPHAAPMFHSTYHVGTMFKLIPEINSRDFWSNRISYAGVNQVNLKILRVCLCLIVGNVYIVTRLVVQFMLQGWPARRALFVFLALQAIVVVFSQPGSGLSPPRVRGYLITRNDAPQSVGLLCTSDQSVAETSTWRHTTLITDKHPCPRWDSNSQSQQASDRRPTP